ncbi:hypothetical protein [Micromonospora sp. NPDC007230]|uniref:hypothetical protein n=1 Tax=Micromonospora sp. NPDC007230 TaxID=3364237 RepID=UPI0036AF3FE1
MRRQAAPGILILLLGLLAACTPPDQPITALAIHDGQPMGVLVTCRGHFSQLDVYEHDNRSDPDDQSLITWGVHGHPTSEVAEVLLFGQPPEGWEVDGLHQIPGSTWEIKPLTELKPGVKYSLSGSSRYKAIPVDFTVEDFARIGPDDVLAPAGRKAMKIMPRETFVRKARKGCD